MEVFSLSFAQTTMDLI